MLDLSLALKNSCELEALSQSIHGSPERPGSLATANISELLQSFGVRDRRLCRVTHLPACSQLVHATRDLQHVKAVALQGIYTYDWL